MKPTVGRLVHYYAEDTEENLDLKNLPIAALVTAVAKDGTSVSLTAFFPDEEPFPLEDGPIEFSEKPQPGCWSWPPRE